MENQRKPEILSASAALLMRGGLTTWSIEGAARQAQCAKGLVLHYFGSKRDLLTAVARELSTRRADRWLAALRSPGIEGLEALWRAIAEEVGSGSARALIELRLSGLDGTTLPADRARALVSGVAAALERPVELLPPPGTLEPILEGYALALLAGASADEAREAFLGYWVSFLRE